MAITGNGAITRLTAALTVLAASLGIAGQARAQASDARAEDASMEEIIVTGHRESAATAQAIKRSAIEVVDSIVAEDVGKLPDNNVADALARVTGVQIRRDSG
jgi:outer membrane receptor for ferrienterochelin and colicin